MINKIKNMKPPQHKTRKIWWWLLFIIPIIWIIGNDSYDKLFERMGKIEKVETLKSVERGVKPESDTVEKSDGIIDDRYWIFIDNVIDRLERVSLLAVSIIMFVIRKKFVGDSKDGTGKK